MFCWIRVVINCWVCVCDSLGRLVFRIDVDVWITAFGVLHGLHVCGVCILYPGTVVPADISLSSIHNLQLICHCEPGLANQTHKTTQ